LREDTPLTLAGGFIMAARDAPPLFPIGAGSAPVPNSCCNAGSALGAVSWVPVAFVNHPRDIRSEVPGRLGGGPSLPPPTDLPTLLPPYRNCPWEGSFNSPRPNLTSHSPPPGRGVVVGWLCRAAVLGATYYCYGSCVNHIALAGRSCGQRCR